MSDKRGEPPCGNKFCPRLPLDMLCEKCANEKISRMKTLLRAARKNIDDVIQYRLVAEIAAELKE